MPIIKQKTKVGQEKFSRTKSTTGKILVGKGQKNLAKKVEPALVSPLDFSIRVIQNRDSKITID